MMTRTHLRIYHGPESPRHATVATAASGKPCITLPVADILPLLADAAQSQRTWLRDFEDDEMTISTDLYEVLLAYRYYRRPSA